MDKNNSPSTAILTHNPETPRVIYSGCIYRHFKKGHLYYIDSISRHTESNELMVNYHALYGDCECHSKPYSMFIEEVPEDKQSENETNQEYRYELLTGRIIYDKEKDIHVYIEEE